MMKRTVPLNSSLEILQPRKVSSNFETIRIFYDFLGDKSPVTSGTRFLQKFRKLGDGSGQVHLK